MNRRILTSLHCPSKPLELNLSVCVFVYVSVYLSVYLSIYLCVSICYSLCLSVCLPVVVLVSLGICLSVCLHVLASVCLPACLPVCPSIYLVYASVWLTLFHLYTTCWHNWPGACVYVGPNVPTRMGILVSHDLVGDIWLVLIKNDSFFTKTAIVLNDLNEMR